MNIEKKDLDKTRELLTELTKLEDVNDVLGNYDSDVRVVYSTGYNNGTKVVKEVSLPMPLNVRESMDKYISKRIAEIKKELKTL